MIKTGENNIMDDEKLELRLNEVKEKLKNLQNNLQNENMKTEKSQELNIEKEIIVLNQLCERYILLMERYTGLLEEVEQKRKVKSIIKEIEDTKSRPENTTNLNNLDHAKNKKNVPIRRKKSGAKGNTVLSILILFLVAIVVILIYFIVRIALGV